jgi:catechol 2,3-dioxygenase-like lactoylglutathione lyase family enzyme
MSVELNHTIILARDKALNEDEFDAAFTRIQESGLTYYADPFHRHSGEINHNDGGRGVYFNDPDGHNMELMTTPYGTIPAR